MKNWKGKGKATWHVTGRRKRTECSRADMVKRVTGHPQSIWVRTSSFVCCEYKSLSLGCQGFNFLSSRNLSPLEFQKVCHEFQHGSHSCVWWRAQSEHKALALHRCAHCPAICCMEGCHKNQTEDGLWLSHLTNWCFIMVFPHAAQNNLSQKHPQSFSTTYPVHLFNRSFW